MRDKKNRNWTHKFITTFQSTFHCVFTNLHSVDVNEQLKLKFVCTKIQFCENLNGTQSIEKWNKKRKQFVFWKMDCSELCEKKKKQPKIEWHWTCFLQNLITFFFYLLVAFFSRYDYKFLINISVHGLSVHGTVEKGSILNAHYNRK